MSGWINLFSDAASMSGWAVAAATVVVAGFIRGFLGFGASLIIVMVLSAVFGPLAAVPVAGLAGLPATVQLLPDAVRLSERAFVLPFALATFAVAPFGAWVLAVADPTVMKMAISVFVLIMVVMMHRGWRFGGEPGRGVLLGAGALAGLAQGLAGVGGPPAVATALSRPGTPHQQRANVIGAVTALALCSLLPYWYNGFYTQQVVIIGLVLTPIYAIASWAGARFFTAGGHQHYRNAALLTLAVIGVVTLALAVRDYYPVEFDFAAPAR
jgi:uncharacterized protein